MQRHIDENGLCWLTFDHLAECQNLVHGIFLRHGGVSEGHFASLNFGLTQGDEALSVALNRKRAADALGISSYHMVYQEHGNRVIEASSTSSHADALITSATNLGLLILHADCQATIIYDPIQKALANVHCGWRGNVQNIYREAILAMRAKYGSKPENLLVGISPSLGPEASEFINYKEEFPAAFHSFQVKECYFDLWAISRWQLVECGVLSEHIEIAGICTYSSYEDFFSYRRVQKSGRHGTFAQLV